MQLNKKEIKELTEVIKKRKGSDKNDPQYENSLKTVEKILKRNKVRK